MQKCADITWYGIRVPDDSGWVTDDQGRPVWFATRTAAESYCIENECDCESIETPEHYHFRMAPQFVPEWENSMLAIDSNGVITERLEIDARIERIFDVLPTPHEEMQRGPTGVDMASPLVLDLSQPSPRRKPGTYRPNDKRRYLVVDLDSFHSWMADRVVIESCGK